MSLINDFLEKITGLDLDGSGSSGNSAQRPCSNCPANCAIAGTACEVCEPYKRKLIDAVYHVDHLDEYYAQYEVVSKPQASSGGTTHCPFCGAGSADPYICEYCGSRLSDAPASSGKIQVSTASEIPNPIMQAQNIIWERYDAVIRKYASDGRSAVKGSLIGDIFSQLIGAEGNEAEPSVLGIKMSEAEIREAASIYKVSVGDYLTGLDNGKYLTLNGKKEADKQEMASSHMPDAMGIPGMAAISMLAGSMFGGNMFGGGNRPQSVPRQPSQPVYRERPVRPSDIPQQESRPRPVRDDDRHTPSGMSERRRPSSDKVSEAPLRPSREHSSGSSSQKDGPRRERHPENRRRDGGGTRI